MCNDIPEVSSVGRRRPLARALFLAVGLIGLGVTAPSRSGDATGQAKQSKGSGASHGANAIPQVPTGDKATAIAYYTAIATELGFPQSDQFVDTHKLQNLLEYCGYKALLAEDLERLGSAVLGNFDELKTKVSNQQAFEQHFGAAPAVDDPIRDVLSVAYFAPKITTVPFSGKLGWRKVVRLKVRTPSPAADKKLDAAYLLFNYFAAPADDSFDYDKSPSVNNQSMLVRMSPEPTQAPMYWFVYNGSKSPDPNDAAFAPGKLILALNASFDAAEAANQPARAYFVPIACAQCHGEKITPDIPKTVFKRAKVNFVDSDHAFDRAGDDFESVKDAPRGVFYDGGNDTTSEQFKTAFSRLRKLNEEIEKQNQVVDANSPAGQRPTFQLRAVQTWLKIHKDDTGHRPLLERGIAPRQMGDKVWSPEPQPNEALTKEEKVELLGLLNRYCYRCHSSFKFHVFDKQMVVDRASDMKDRLDLADLQSHLMPQDRILDAGVKARLKELLTKVETEGSPAPPTSHGVR